SDVPMKSTVGSRKSGVGSRTADRLVAFDVVSVEPLPTPDSRLPALALRDVSALAPSFVAGLHAPASSKNTSPYLMLVARGLTKEFQSGTHRLTVLRDVSFTVAQGAHLSIVGPSGSGKTTLLGLLAGLDTPTRGAVLLDGDDLTAMTEDQRARLRG